RPRNAFIIFRCQYSRENARGAQAGDSDRQTMSKRAGEAWKFLSSTEKDHYKELAEQEKNDHALAHPGYHYRP
ncbi:high mobility group box domain-containing protein, partial [Rhodocollybia butyracea]